MPPCLLVEFQNPTPWRSSEFLGGEGGGGSKTFYKEKNETKLEFPKGAGGTKTKKQKSFRLVICCCFLLESYQIQLQMFVQRI